MKQVIDFEKWNKPKDITGSERCNVIKQGGKKILQIKFPKGVFGLNGGVRWHTELDKSYEELSYQYRIKFEKGFNFKRGGKLPGLAGGTKPRGGRHSKRGFSARIMWREGGLIEQYVYAPTDKHGNFGRDLFLYSLNSKKIVPIKFKPGKWYTIKTKIKMNKFKWKGNGYITCWVDGELALHQDIKLRSKESNHGIDTFIFTTFFGGGDKTWAPVKNERIYFDKIIISDKEIKN